MTGSEGVVQYRLAFEPGPLPAGGDWRPLLRWFAWCRARELVGQDPQRYDGYAFGNLSLRAAHGFVISGTQTAGKSALTTDDLAWVLEFDASRNALRATGACRPSSEAMTHGELYRAMPQVNAVIHVHSAPIWRNAASLGIPLTDPAAGYGTPAMAAEVKRMAAAAGADAAGIVAMGGHEDGIIAFAASMEAAGRQLAAVLDAVQPATREEPVRDGA